MTDEDLKAAIREVRERVQNRKDASLVLPDLLPLVHARDAAEAKVASIGSVNPRAKGFANSIIQSIKRLVARALAWHVREQVEFNRASILSMQSTLEALNETNRALGVLSTQVQEYARQVTDHRTDHEIYTLRAISELQASFKQQVEEMKKALDQAHTGYEHLIHSELRLVRQRSGLLNTAAGASVSQPSNPSSLLSGPEADSAIDWLRFAERFRGPEDIVRAHQRRYLSKFTGSAPILDLGCGRGEFLEVAREAGIAAIGIDSNSEFVALCRTKGLDAHQADLFAYLSALSDHWLDGVFCSHVIEHMEPAQLPILIRLLGHKMKPGAPAVFETPNAESAKILTTHFFLDPTHVRPVPAALLSFYLEESGFGGIEIEYLPPDQLDYSAFARKL